MKSKKRMVAVANAEFLGRDGIVAVSKASGKSRSTINIGMKKIQSGSVLDIERVRKEGGKKLYLKQISPLSHLAIMSANQPPTGE